MAPTKETPQVEIRYIYCATVDSPEPVKDLRKENDALRKENRRLQVEIHQLRNRRK